MDTKQHDNLPPAPGTESTEVQSPFCGDLRSKKFFMLDVLPTEEDQFVPKEAQALILATLKNHPQIEIHTYPGRDHAFAREGVEHYDAADAKLAGGRTLAFFNQHLA